MDPSPLSQRMGHHGTAVNHVSNSSAAAASAATNKEGLLDLERQFAATRSDWIRYRNAQGKLIKDLERQILEWNSRGLDAPVFIKELAKQKKILKGKAEEFWVAQRKFEENSSHLLQSSTG